MKIHHMEQQTPEWFAIRKGKMSASHAQAIGANGKGLETYISELMSEYYSSGEKDQYTNEHIERGNELESIARSMYELQNSVRIQQVGFIEYSDYAGGSPDGLIGEDGIIEIKCPADKKHFLMILNGQKEIDSAYIWQMQMNMLISGRSYGIFISYNPNFEKSLLCYRIEKDEVAHGKLKLGLSAGENMIREIIKKVET